jgi:hypothetical protein
MLAAASVFALAPAGCDRGATGQTGRGETDEGGLTGVLTISGELPA